METSLKLTSGRSTPETLQALTRDLAESLRDNTDIVAELPDAAPEPGARGDPVTLGVLALAFVTSGSAVALFEVLKAYFERDSSLEMEFERADGRKMSIRAENVNPRQIDNTMAAAREFFGDEG